MATDSLNLDVEPQQSAFGLFGCSESVTDRDDSSEVELDDVHTKQLDSSTARLMQDSFGDTTPRSSVNMLSEQCSDASKSHSDLSFASSPKSDVDMDETCKGAASSHSGSGPVNLIKNRKHSLDSELMRTETRQKSYDPLLSPEPEHGSETDHREHKAIKVHSISYESGMSSLATKQQSRPGQAAGRTKKTIHYRSMSDYGLPHKAILEDGSSEGRSSGSTSLSASYPTNPSGKLNSFKQCVNFRCLATLFVSTQLLCFGT